MPAYTIITRLIDASGTHRIWVENEVLGTLMLKFESDPSDEEVAAAVQYQIDVRTPPNEPDGGAA